jgi:hypothetical protein
MTYVVRDLRTRPRLWWHTEYFGPWPSGLCVVCGVPVGGLTSFWINHEDSRERLCLYCHQWAKRELSH